MGKVKTLSDALAYQPESQYGLVEKISKPEYADNMTLTLTRRMREIAIKAKKKVSSYEVIVLSDTVAIKWWM